MTSDYKGRRRIHARIRRAGRLARAVLAGAIALSVLPVSAGAQGSATELEIRYSPVTGLARFVTPRRGKTIAVPRRGVTARPQPSEFLHEYGPLFGVSDPAKQLVQSRTQRDSIGYAHTSYQQYHQGIRVFSAVLKVHQDARGAFTAANGDFHPIQTTFDLSSAMYEEEAVGVASAEIASGALVLESTELVIVDPAWYGDPPRGTRLAYYIILADTSVPLREAFFVDAQTGEVLDQWSLIHTTRSRRPGK